MFAQIVIGLIAIIHLYILWLEMFAWTTRGPKVFGNFPKNFFEDSKTLAANQGLYNGFLAAGLIWSLFICDVTWKQNVSIFFLLCVLVAGLYGAATSSKRILFVQAIPAAVGLTLVLISKYL